MLVSASNCQAIYVCVEELSVQSPRNLVVASLSVVWKDLVDRESGLELLQSAILLQPWKKCHESIDELTEQGIAPDYTLIYKNWKQTVSDILTRATLTIPEDGFMQKGSLEGKHSEFLGHLLGDMQFLQRAYPDASW